MNFGEYLKSLRKIKFTQKEFADIIGVDHSYISKLENGKAGVPTDLTLYMIAKLLNVDPLDLFYRAGKLSKNTVKTIQSYPELREALSSNLGSPTSDLEIEKTQKLSIFYQLPLPALLISLEDMLIADLNISAVNLYGYDKTSIVGKPMSILEFDSSVVYEDSDNNTKECDDIISLSTKFTQHINKAKDIVPVKIITSPIFIKSKLYILKIIEKLDQLYYQNGCAQSNAIENARIFEYAPLPIFLFKLDENAQPNKFIYTNSSASELTGYSKEELLEFDPFILNSDEEKDIISGLFDVLLIEFKAFATTTIISKNGTLKKCCISASMINICDNKYIYVLITEVID